MSTEFDLRMDSSNQCHSFDIKKKIYFKLQLIENLSLFDKEIYLFSMYWRKNSSSNLIKVK